MQPPWKLHFYQQLAARQPACHQSVSSVLLWFAWQGLKTDKSSRQSDRGVLSWVVMFGVVGMGNLKNPLISDDAVLQNTPPPFGRSGGVSYVPSMRGLFSNTRKTWHDFHAPSLSVLDGWGGVWWTRWGWKKGLCSIFHYPFNHDMSGMIESCHQNKLGALFW